MRKTVLKNITDGGENLPVQRPITLINWEHQEVLFGDTENALRQAAACTREALKENTLPVFLGNEHILMLGSLAEVLEQYPNVCVIQFDARADLNNSFLSEPLGHPCVMRRCWELLGDHRIYQFGIRDGNRDEFRWAQEHTCLQRFSFHGLENVLEKLKKKPVYFTIDLDILDPEYYPGAVQPLQGGVSPSELTRAARLVCSSAWIVGCDISELSASYDPNGTSVRTAKKIASEILRYLLNSPCPKTACTAQIHRDDRQINAQPHPSTSPMRK